MRLSRLLSAGAGAALAACSVSACGGTVEISGVQAGGSGGVEAGTDVSSGGTQGGSGGHDASAGSGGTAGTGANGGSGAGGVGVDSGGDAGAQADVCIPGSCIQLGYECGSGPDGCDGLVVCGGCSPGQVCGGGGPNKCGAGGSGGSSGTGGSSGSGGAYTCPTSGGPTMVLLPQGYCIDSTEVTRDQYAAWLATNPSTSGQDTVCAWNSDFTPDEMCMGASDVCYGANCGGHPQACVDWCDAFAYCKAVGKRLCGKIGGGSNGHDDYADATKSQWYHACVSDGVNDAYPYGSAYDGQACNGVALHAGTTVPVATLPNCQSPVAGYEGIFDLSGNLFEWEDSCDQYDDCRMRGGAFIWGEDQLRCDSDIGGVRNGSGDLVGFRCCAP